MDSLPVHKVTPRSSPHRPAWYKACEADINCYTFELNEKLAKLHYPHQLDCLDPHCCIAEHLQARDSFLLDNLIAMIETSHATIPMGGGTRRKWDPDKNCMIETALPGWREEL